MIPPISTTQIEEFRRKAQEKRKRRRREVVDEVEREFLADMKAIERLASLAGESRHGGAEEKASPVTESHKKEKAQGPTTMVNTALKKCHGTFSVKDIERIIGESTPKTIFPTKKLSAVLIRFRDNGSLRLVKQGKGNAPSTYRKNLDSKDLPPAVPDGNGGEVTH